MQTILSFFKQIVIIVTLKIQKNNMVCGCKIVNLMVEKIVWQLDVDDGQINKRLCWFGVKFEIIGWHDDGWKKL
jgi:hypothetical protein